jgi:uncharacterized membrane protein (UPF0182 family)
VIPIENSFLYVVPLYLRAEGANFPQLKRVIAATGNKVVMEPTLDEALSALFSSPGVPQSEAQAPLRNTVLRSSQIRSIASACGSSEPSGRYSMGIRSIAC